MGGIPSCMEALEFSECVELTCLAIPNEQEISEYENSGRTEAIQDIYLESPQHPRPQLHTTLTTHSKRGLPQFEDERYAMIMNAGMFSRTSFINDKLLYFKV